MAVRRSIRGPFSPSGEGQWWPVLDGGWGGEDGSVQTPGCGRGSGVSRENSLLLSPPPPFIVFS